MVNNDLILYSYSLWNNPTDFLPLLVMHVCVCLLFPSLCLRMWSFGNYKRRSSRSATMDRFPAIFLSSLSLMTASTASHGFGLNLVRATWSQVSFPFTIVSARDVLSPHDSHPLPLFNFLFSNHTSLTFTVIILGFLHFLCVPSLLHHLMIFLEDSSSVGSHPLSAFPLEVSVTVYHLLHFRWDRGYLPWCICQQGLCDHPELRGR